MVVDEAQCGVPAFFPLPFFLVDYLLLIPLEKVSGVIKKVALADRALIGGWWCFCS